MGFASVEAETPKVPHLANAEFLFGTKPALAIDQIDDQDDYMQNNCRELD